MPGRGRTTKRKRPRLLPGPWPCFRKWFRLQPSTDLTKQGHFCWVALGGLVPTSPAASLETVLERTSWIRSGSSAGRGNARGDHGERQGHTFARRSRARLLRRDVAG